MAETVPVGGAVVAGVTLAVPVDPGAAVPTGVSCAVVVAVPAVDTVGVWLTGVGGCGPITTGLLVGAAVALVATVA